MQRTANLITALTALALAVAFVTGIHFQTQRTDAAAATIAALNVGTCHTTDNDVLSEEDCNPHHSTFEFNRQGLDDAIEVDELYATYAHDPKTADEPPRAILKDADLIKISIKDEGRDVRSGVIVNSGDTTTPAPWESTENWGDLTVDTVLRPDIDDTENDQGTVVTGDDGPVTQFGGIIAAAISGYTFQGSDDDDTNVPNIETAYTFRRTDGTDSGANPVTITQSGIVEILFSELGDPTMDKYKPIAGAGSRGEMRFFGTVANPGPDGTAGNADDLDEPFGELDDYLVWDEDVESGTDNAAPAFSLRADLRAGDTVTLRAIHYLTSQVEVMKGGEKCLPQTGVADDPRTPDVEDDRIEKGTQVACTEDELGDEYDEFDLIKLDVSSDGVQTTRNLWLQETDRFTGVFEGYLRLTDSDGDGVAIDSDGERDENDMRRNWGLVVKHATGHTTGNDDEGNFQGAILGVDNGPVRVAYKDTDGATRNFTISIDIGPPTIDVTSPTHEGRSDDEEINFAGSLNDGESGLAEDTFVLYLDHDDDPEDMEPGSIHLPVDESPQSDDDLGNVIADPGPVASAPVTTIATETQYFGYNTSPTYGIVLASKLYRQDEENEVTNDDDENKLKGIDAEDYADGSSDAAFRDSIRVNFLQGQEDRVYNHAIDFHALVRDTAGNIGFSDSDEANPRYINDLGTKGDDRLGTTGQKPLPNVIGVFSRHVVYIDNVDPKIEERKTVTGFFDLNNDDEPVIDRSGVMVVFDGPVDSRSINENTFMLTIGEDDNKETLDVIEAKVSGKLVFLKLADELASDAKPKLTISAGEEVRDLAGRVTRSDEQDEIEVNDGNLPIFTISLSDGSGLGEDAEGPTRLTNDTIKVSISSDEDIQGAPKVAVVCSNLSYPGEGDNDDERGLSDYVNGLSGATDGQRPGTIKIDTASCGSSTFNVRPASSLSRRGNQWEYTWRQYDGNAVVPDGLATVVVWGNDRSDYEYYDNTKVYRNWGSTSSEFRFDNSFVTPLDVRSGGRVLPAKDSDVAERRPFVLLDFSGEPTTVTVSELMVDDVDVTNSIDIKGQNQFLYWPETLSSGEHEVKFSANDAANNKVENQSFKFTVTSRDPFVLSLFAGWNAISFPADPIENTLDDIFGDSAVERVIGWIPQSTTGPWAVATKADGVWTTSTETATLNTLRAQYGYWVYSTEFVDVSVELRGPIDRETGGVPGLTGVPTYPGWNFVGVVDQDGDQTEGRAGSNLKDGIINVAGEANVGQQDDMLVKDYLAGFARAYRWDVITNSYRVLGGNDNLKIGEGIWAYFSDGIAP